MQGTVSIRAEPGTVLLHATVSADGYIAGPGDDQAWVFELSAPSPEAEDVIATTGAMLSGRRTYDVGLRDDRPAFEGAWTGPVLVLTHRPPDDAPASVIFLDTDVADAVDRAREAARGGNVVVTGADVARQCLDAGLIDEVLLHVVPVLLGEGVRLFPPRVTGRIDLDPVSTMTRGRTTVLHYRVHRDSPTSSVGRSEPWTR